MSTSRRIAARHVASCAAAGLACVLQVAWATTDPPVAGPLGGGESMMLEPAPNHANPRRQRAVFVCQEDGTPVYADRPCGSMTTARSIVIDTPRTGAASTTAPPSPQASTRPRVAPPKPDSAQFPGQETACTKLQRQLDELNDRMRAGYSAREAAKLWQRWRDTKERLRTTRC